MIETRSEPARPTVPETVSDYERAQRRRALYRVLATNVIRELREAGYHGHELLEFASEVMQAITDNGWGDPPVRDAAAKPVEPAFRAKLALSLNACGLPTILGKLVNLRPPVPADREHLERWLEEPLVRNSLIPPELRHVLSALNDGAPGKDRVDLMVCESSGERPVGLVSLHDLDPIARQAALGKMIGNPEYRGKGVAHEATRLILAYGFDSLELHRIYLRTLGGSLKNIKLNERLGFRFEGVLEDAAVSEGKFADVVLMAMLREEFRLTGQ